MAGSICGSLSRSPSLSHSLSLSCSVSTIVLRVSSIVCYEIVVETVAIKLRIEHELPPVPPAGDGGNKRLVNVLSNITSLLHQLRVARKGIPVPGFVSHRTSVRKQ